MKRIYAAIVVVLLLIAIPFVLWQMNDEQDMAIAIIDKSVATDTYREHLGLNWLLAYERYANDGEPYSLSEHYFGAVPATDGKSVTERPLPTDYSDYDVIYLADTYGVFEDDLVREDEEHDRAGARSKKIYGGLELEEWQNIVARLSTEEKSLLVAEYNSFASPTAADVRNEMTEFMGIDWDGWVGRYFDELDFTKNDEMPQWVVDDYGDTWQYEGGGFLLVNDLTEELIVLELEKHVSEPGIRVEFTEQGKKQFGVTNSANYNYWFDIVNAYPSATAYAHYDWDLTDEGEALLEAHGIPAQFAAIIGKDRQYATTYYFAGDYNDMQTVPTFYKMLGTPTLYKYMQMFSADAFYWTTYVPVMTNILQSFEEKNVEDVAIPDELHHNARIHNDKFEVQLEDGSWRAMTLKGVNLGMGKPGYFPGEAAISEEEYYRWFEQIADMNANTVRVYTLQPTGFYNALKAFNEQAEEPLYIFHGVWINEEQLVESLDAYAHEPLEGFQEEMRTIVDVIHGNAYVPTRVGHASGIYDADVSEYIAGWIIGIEWFQDMVVGTNEKHANIGQYNGTYFETKEGSPFEHWLAEQMDYMLKYEADHYNWIRPMSFTNWVTTDLLDHPYEPTPETEDLVGVDPNHIYTKAEAKTTGQFASYHVYPYYPDFLNFDENYLNYVDHRGNKNSYAGYLHELRAAHNIPVLVAEFGIPSSRGSTHHNVYGWNQGGVSEKDQGKYLVSLFEDMIAEDYLGGLVFTWQDEWFKRTWNTMDYDNPDRRPYWSNQQTSEQHFGLLAFETMKIKVDNSTEDWQDIDPLYSEQQATMSVTHDETYIYVQLQSEALKNGEARILIDTVPHQGNTTAPALPNITTTNALEFVVELRNNGESRVTIDPYYDFYNFLYAVQQQPPLIANKIPNPMKNNGQFTTIDFVLNKELTIPATGELVPYSAYETGKLEQGNGNPEAEDYNSMTDYSWHDDTIEVRMPWMMLQARDPSQREFIGDMYTDGYEASEKVEEIYIGAAIVNNAGAVVTTLPAATNNTVPALSSYTWETWNIPPSKERLKQSYDIVKDAFATYK